MIASGIKNNDGLIVGSAGDHRVTCIDKENMRMINKFVLLEI